MSRFLISGGAGFIGSYVVRALFTRSTHSVYVVDKFTYSGNLVSLDALEQACGKCEFVERGIFNSYQLVKLFEIFKPDRDIDWLFDLLHSSYNNLNHPAVQEVAASCNK